MTKTLIQPSEVVALAFTDRPYGVAEKISSSLILVAEQRYLEPTLGDFYKILKQGNHPTFVDEYIKPALAQFVKACALPFLCVVLGENGVAYINGTSKVQIAGDDLQFLINQSIADGNSLLYRATDYLLSSEDFADDLNVSSIKSIQFAGGIIL